MTAASLPGLLAAALLGAAAPANAGWPLPPAVSTLLGPPVQVSQIAPTDRQLGPTSPITVTFTARPTGQPPQLSPQVPGQWTVLGNTETFHPAADWAAYTPVTVTVPAGTTAFLRRPLSQTVVAGFRAPTPTLLRVQQILARLGYLPLTFSAGAAQPRTAAAESAAGYAPPTGAFSWTAPALRTILGGLWAPGASSTLTTGALMAFQADHQLAVDGVLGPQSWAALTAADLADTRAGTPYTDVVADLTLPQTLTVYAAGQPVLRSLVNSGIAGARTALGTFPIYRRVSSDTMRGTMPDGVSYVDVGVPWDNYFDGGEAVHGFARSAYGYPQSNGCLELPIPTAEQVYGLLHLGDLVTVVGDPTQ